MTLQKDVVIIKDDETIFERTKGYLYLLPALALLTLFMFWPFVQTLYRSLFLTNSLGGNVDYLGLSNYIELLKSDSFWNSIRVTLNFVVIVVVFGVTLGFLTALLSQKTFPGIKFFTTSYAMPMAVASAGMALIFQVMLNPTVGIINRMLGTYVNYLTRPDTALLVVGILTGWLNSGMNFLYFSSGLASIDETLYESGQIDGANGLQSFLYITIPSLKPTLFFVIVTNVINAFQGFGQINILTKGGPGSSTNVIVYDIYRNAFMNYRYGFASAESVILFLIVMVLTYLMFKLRKMGN